jgi:hypothetical protein
MSEQLDLADWRRRVASLYATLRADRRAAQLRLVAFRAGKDRLFAEHPSSPVPPDARRSFRGLAYWRHDPNLRFTAALEPDPQAAAPDVPRSGEGPPMPFSRIGWVSFDASDTACRLAVYWLNDYAGAPLTRTAGGRPAGTSSRPSPAPSWTATARPWPATTITACRRTWRS